jgi:hypothetical protein
MYQKKIKRSHMHMQVEDRLHQEQDRVTACLCENIHDIKKDKCSRMHMQVEDRLHQEQDRVTACLSTEYSAGEGGIKHVVEHELIGRHMQTLVEKENSGLVSLLEAQPPRIEVRTRNHPQRDNLESQRSSFIFIALNLESLIWSHRDLLFRDNLESHRSSLFLLRLIWNH